MESKNTVSKNFSWADVDWEALRRLRAGFLSFDEQTGAAGDYWQSLRELASYDFTFAERIGWKWDRVLSGLSMLGWIPPQGAVLDWGCGTGVASRRVVRHWPRQFQRLKLWDRSRLALQYAAERSLAELPRMPVECTDGSATAETVIVSHLLNELDDRGLRQLLAVVRQAQAVLWVEPGTHAVSRKLIAVREELMDTFRPVAPCVHAGRCGLLTPENAHHWCHHFARPPGEVFHDPGWGKFAQLMEIDLGSVPFAYLVLDRRPAAENSPRRSRVIGVPRYYKGHHKILSCEGEEGVLELTLQKRDDGSLFKEMKRDPGSLYEWQREGEKIRSGKRIV